MLFNSESQAIEVISDFEWNMNLINVSISHGE